MCVLYRIPPLEGSANSHVIQALDVLLRPLLIVRILTCFHPVGKIATVP